MPTPVYVFPIPGSHTALPVPRSRCAECPSASSGRSRSPAPKRHHAGTVEADSDGHGGSFLPAKPFAAGETVTVRTAMDIVGGSSGSYQFVVASPAGRIPLGRRPPTPRVEVTSSDSTPNPVWFR